VDWLTLDDRDPAEPYELQVVAVSLEAEGIISIRLRDPRGDDLPAWSPGAHLDLILPSGLVRQYSLSGNVRDQKTYRIAVLREDAGRGGSAEVHDLPLVGRMVKVRGPRNHFEVHEADSYVFIAGGIGITPILSMITALPPNAAWSLYYAGRSRASMAFIEEVISIGGERVRLYPKDEGRRFDLDAILQEIDPHAELYCCGPPSLLEAVETRKKELAPDVMLYAERFVAGADSKILTAEAQHRQSAFEVELRQSNVVLMVPADRSTLSVIRDVLPDVPFSCEEGYCGSCETRVLAGVPEHRDDVLTPEERAANKTMMTCVGRALTPRLVLDL
jgi:ferredoxin-NADP reductase